MKNKILVFLIMGHGLLLSPAIRSQSTFDLYEARLPVERVAETVQAPVLKQALTQVLVKLSGDQHLPLKPSIQNQLKQGEQLIDEFKYHKVEQQPWLIVHFYPDAIDALAQQLELPIWRTSVRPTLLIWIVLNETGERHSILQESPEEPYIKAVQLIKTQAQQRGLPILFPLLDLDDLRTLTINDIAEGRVDAMMKIVERYRVKAFLTGYIQQTTRDWQTQWRLYINDKIVYWKNSHPSLNPALINGINKTVDTLAQQQVNVIDAPGGNSFEINIVGTLTLTDYARINNYLQNLDIINEFKMLQMQSGQITFLVSVEGGHTALVQAFKMGNILVPLKPRQNLYQYVQH